MGTWGGYNLKIYLWLNHKSPISSYNWVLVSVVQWLMQCVRKRKREKASQCSDDSNQELARVQLHFQQVSQSASAASAASAASEASAATAASAASAASAATSASLSLEYQLEFPTQHLDEAQFLDFDELCGCKCN